MVQPPNVNMYSRTAAFLPSSRPRTVVAFNAEHCAGFLLDAAWPSCMYNRHCKLVRPALFLCLPQLHRKAASRMDCAINKCHGIGAAGSLESLLAVAPTRSSDHQISPLPVDSIRYFYAAGRQASGCASGKVMERPACCWLSDLSLQLALPSQTL